MEGGKTEEAGPSCGCEEMMMMKKKQDDEVKEKLVNDFDDRKTEDGFDDINNDVNVVDDVNVNVDVDVDDEHDQEDVKNGGDVERFVPGPLFSLKEQIEKDKEDESLRRWKEKLLGCLESDINGQKEPEVKFRSIGIVSSDFGETNTLLPVDESRRKRVLFTLKEGSEFRLKLTFTVLHNIVSGLAYSNTVWKAGVQVDRSKGMLGTFAPQREPYVHTLEEETAPSGVLARGIYTAKLKFEDDDKRCHFELEYSFEIRKS